MVGTRLEIKVSTFEIEKLWSNMASIRRRKLRDKSSSV